MPLPFLKTSVVSSKLLPLAGLEKDTLSEFGRFMAAVRGVDQQESIGSSPSKGRVGGTLSTIKEQLARRTRWRQLAERSWSDGRIITACSYELRIMRLAGHDVDGRLPRVTDAMAECSFSHVIEAARANFQGLQTQQQIDQGLDILRQAFDSNRTNSLPENAVLMDRRAQGKPRVSLIVSLYNAESKLEFFLRRVARQTIHFRGELEVILVDSNSPTNERQLANRVGPELNFSYAYLRTADREPIALAWNRGLALARGEYVAFWGVDEGGPDNALEILAQYLDKHSQVDWIQSDAVSYDLADDGTILGQSRSYDRSGLSKETIYANHQYLTYVGGMYRRSIHDRIGYYSSKFRAAGDTEFKFRVLPHIQVGHLARPLGEYLNYAEDRLTEHPRAEIEDVLAHDLHHSPAGVAYAFPDAELGQLWPLLELALKHRPCAHQFWATDLDYASSITRYLEASGKLPVEQRPLVRLIDKCLDQYRKLDAPSASWGQLSKVGWTCWKLQKRFRKSTNNRYQPAMWLFNDARYTRYYRPWSDSLEASRSATGER
ncbi:glycosyltransferase [Bremerella sp.]|uniref:glycosyltransferase n=1 Tax=Bremerella sp. TaxID=2795602 RepID=UPI00391A601C